MGVEGRCAATTAPMASLSRPKDGVRVGKAKALVYDDGRLRNAGYDASQGFGLRAVRGEVTVIVDEHRPVPLQQHVHPAPGDPQLHRGFVDDSQSHWIVLGQATDHPGPQPGLLPLTLGHRKHARSSHLILVAVHARLLIENRTTEQMRR